MRTAWIFAILAGGVSGFVAWQLIGRPGHVADILHVWFAARTFLGAVDPYSVPLAIDLNPGSDPAFYPLPTYLLFAPLAFLPAPVAGGVFVGLGATLMAWGVARTGMARAPLFLSAPFIMSVSLGQWGPWLVAAALMPWFSWLVVAKPNLGLAVWLARPSWRTAAAVASIVLVSLLIDPSWPGHWLGNLSGGEGKFIPLLRPGGFVLAAASLAWRRADARLLLALSAMPQTLFFYDQLLLWLIPRTLRQSLLLSLFSIGVFLLWFAGLEPGDYYVREAAPFAFSLYAPALLLVVWNWYQTDRARKPMVAIAP